MSCNNNEGQGYTCDQLAYANYKRGYDPMSFPLTVKEGYCSPCVANFRNLGDAFSNNPFAKVQLQENFSMNSQDAYLSMNRAYGMNNFPKPTGGKSCISIK